MAKDANFDKVSLLLRCDGANGSTSIVDSSPLGHTVTAVGNAAISTAKSKFGGASLYTGTVGATIPSSTAFDFGSGDMTIEFFFSATSQDESAALITREWVGDPWSGGWSIQLHAGTGGPLRIYFADWYPGGPFLVGTTTSHADGNMHHFAWTKKGNVHRMFLDGVLEATATTSVAFVSANKNLTLGADLTFGPRSLNGYMDDIRITKGLARYTANFTPPTAPHPMAGSLSGTVLDASGAPAARLVRAMREDTGAFVGSATSDAGTGAYSIAATADTPHTLIAYPGTGEDLPALTLRGVVPV